MTLKGLIWQPNIFHCFNTMLTWVLMTMMNYNITSLICTIPGIHCFFTRLHCDIMGLHCSMTTLHCDITMSFNDFAALHMNSTMFYYDITNFTPWHNNAALWHHSAELWCTMLNHNPSTELRHHHCVKTVQHWDTMCAGSTQWIHQNTLCHHNG